MINHMHAHYYTQHVSDSKSYLASLEFTGIGFTKHHMKDCKRLAWN